MYTLGDMAKELNRSPVYLHGLQDRFGLPVFKGKGYSDAYLAFLRMVVMLRALNVSEDALRRLWEIEKKLLVLLHVDSTGSATWFLDACGQTGRYARRLLLTNVDMGIRLPSKAVQLGLDFSAQLPELFEGREMGEDALRVFSQCMKVHTQIQTTMRCEAPLLRAALHCVRKRGGG